MLSQRTHCEIGRLTAEALKVIGGQEVIDRVTVIRGYEQLLGMYPNRQDFQKSLAKGVLDLQQLAERRQSTHLATQLQVISAYLAAENAS